MHVQNKVPSSAHLMIVTISKFYLLYKWLTILKQLDLCYLLFSQKPLVVSLLVENVGLNSIANNAVVKCNVI